MKGSRAQKLADSVAFQSKCNRKSAGRKSLNKAINSITISANGVLYPVQFQ